RIQWNHGGHGLTDHRGPFRNVHTTAKFPRFDRHFAGVRGDLKRCELDQNITTSLHWAMFGQPSTELRSTLGQSSVELRLKRLRGGWLPRL
ncbi:MAG: hypothetical protein QMC65_02475, partial [Candidatus Poseidoniaceae archaeon]